MTKHFKPGPIFLRLLFANLLFGWQPVATQACDICGCGAGNLYFGFMPNGDKHNLVFRYRTLAFNSHVKETGEYADLFRSREDFQVLDLMGRFRIGSRFQAMILLPYVFAQQKMAEGIKQNQGIADGLVQVQYRLIDTEHGSSEKEWKHQLFLGSGLKAPIGNWQMEGDHKTIVQNPNFQPGTGSWDWLLTSQYTLRYKKWMLWQDAQFRKNGENENRYHFGNRITGNLNLMYQIQNQARRSFMPLLGLYGEYGLVNKSHGYEVEHTGGSLWMTNVGAQFFFRSWSLMGQYQKPIYQNLGQGNLQALDRWQVQLGWSF